MQVMYSPQYQVAPQSGSQPGPMLSSYPPQQPPHQPSQRHPFPSGAATSASATASQPVFTPESNPSPGTCQPGQQGFHHPGHGQSQTAGTPVNFGPMSSVNQQQYQQQPRHNNNNNSSHMMLPNGDGQQRPHVMPQQQQHPAIESSRAALHGYIYDYLYKSGFHQSAQAFLRDVPHVPVVPKPAADGVSTAKGQATTKNAFNEDSQPQQKKGASTSLQNSPNDFFDDLLAATDVPSGHERPVNGAVGHSSHGGEDGPGQALHHQKSSNSSDRSSATSTSTNHSRFGFAAARPENDQGSATTPSDPGSSPSRVGTAGSSAGPHHKSVNQQHTTTPVLPEPAVEFKHPKGFLSAWWSVHWDIFAAMRLQKGSTAARGFVDYRANQRGVGPAKPQSAQQQQQPNMQMMQQRAQMEAVQRAQAQHRVQAHPRQPQPISSSGAMQPPPSAAQQQQQRMHQLQLQQQQRAQGGRPQVVPSAPSPASGPQSQPQSQSGYEQHAAAMARAQAAQHQQHAQGQPYQQRPLSAQQQHSQVYGAQPEQYAQMQAWKQQQQQQQHQQQQQAAAGQSPAGLVSSSHHGTPMQQPGTPAAGSGAAMAAPTPTPPHTPQTNGGYTQQQHQHQHQQSLHDGAGAEHRNSRKRAADHLDQSQADSSKRRSMRGSDRSQPAAPTASEDPTSSAGTPNQQPPPPPGQAQAQAQSHQPPQAPDSSAANGNTSSAELAVGQSSSSSASFANLSGSMDFGSLQDPGNYLSLSGLDSGTGADGGDMMDPSLWEMFVADT